MKELQDKEPSSQQEVGATGTGMGQTEIWEAIDSSESYLVCSMYEEAASLASSALRAIRDKNNVLSEEAVDDIQLHDMLESAGMVFVQSLKGLGRTKEILDELKLLIAPVAAIPVQVLLTGVCFQISEGAYSGVQEILEEFLSKWIFVDERYYALVGADANLNFMEECDGTFHLCIDSYMEVVEVYVMTLLSTIQKDVDLAISWVEKAALPEEKRQGLLRRLQSLHSLRTTNVSHSSSVLPEDKHEVHYSSLKDPIAYGGSPKASKANNLLNGETNTKQAILKLPRQENSSLWWLLTIISKFGKAWSIISSGKIVLSLFIFIFYYVLRRKRAALIRTIRRQVLALKKALVDLWQLAFSYQVNPLAAIQPLPVGTRGS